MAYAETVGQHVIPRVAEAYEHGEMPEMLPGNRQLEAGA